MQSGSHIKVSRLLYDHHGIYLGNSVVIHLSGSVRPNPSSLQRISHKFAVSSSGSFGVGDAIIRIDRLDAFSQGLPVKVVQQPRSDTERKEVLLRAYSKYKTFGYSLIKNNCEHFCYWCYGKKKSKQVTNWMVGLALGAIAAISAGNLVVGGVFFAAGTGISHLARNRPDNVNGPEAIIDRTQFLNDASVLLLAGKATCHGDDMLREMGWLVEIILHDENNGDFSFVNFRNQNSGTEQLLRFGANGEGFVVVNSPVMDGVFANLNGFLSHLGFSEELAVKVAAEVTQGIARLRTMVNLEGEGEI